MPAQQEPVGAEVAPTHDKSKESAVDISYEDLHHVVCALRGRADIRHILAHTYMSPYPPLVALSFCWLALDAHSRIVSKDQSIT